PAALTPAMVQLRTPRSRGQRPRLQLRRKEFAGRPTNGHGCNHNCRTSAARARGSADEKLEALGTVPIGTTMGDGARRLFTIRKLLGLFSARPCAKPRVSLGRRRPSRYFGSAMPSLFRPCALEREGSDLKGATFRSHWIGKQPRRGRKGTLFLPRLDAHEFVHEGALQIRAARISVRPPDRRESAAWLGRARARADRYRRF